MIDKIMPKNCNGVVFACNIIQENKIISKDFIAEKYVAGEEYTVGIIENQALPGGAPRGPRKKW